MDSSPDFKSYTLDELFEVQQSVDRGKYPERAKEIDDAISQRMSVPAAKAGIGKRVNLDKYSTFSPRF